LRWLEEASGIDEPTEQLPHLAVVRTALWSAPWDLEGGLRDILDTGRLGLSVTHRHLVARGEAGSVALRFWLTRVTG
jgi:hypothetical protein